MARSAEEDGIWGIWVKRYNSDGSFRSADWARDEETGEIMRWKSFDSAHDECVHGVKSQVDDVRVIEP